MSEEILKVIITQVFALLIAIVSSSWWTAKVTTKKLKTDEIIDKINALDYKIDRNQADADRARILRFNGEIKREIHHDEEEFNDVIEAIDRYETFCAANKNTYKNNKAVMAIKNIKRVYELAFRKNFM